MFAALSIVGLAGVGGLATLQSNASAAVTNPVSAVVSTPGTSQMGKESATEQPEARGTSAEADGPGGHQDAANASNANHQFNGQE